MSNDILANDALTALDGPDIRDAFKRYVYNHPRNSEKNQRLSFGDVKTPAETDLLPDDEFEIDEIQPESMHFKDAYEYDVAVIGSGPAGHTSAIRAARLGAKVVLFENDHLTNAGYVPVKAYLNSDAVGARDLQGIVSLRNSVAAKMTTDAARTLRACKVRVESGEAVLKSPHEILCRGKIYSSSKIILCGGSKNNRSNITGAFHPGVLAADDIFKTSDIPHRLLILGGGREGCELAATFAAFGSNVVLVEGEQRLLPDWDRNISEAVWKALRDTGIKVYTGTTINEIRDVDGNPYVVTERGGLLCDKVLLATGRKPEISFLGNMSDEFRFYNNALAVNEYLETSMPGIYATSDMTGYSDQNHISRKIAETAASNAMGKHKPLDLRAAPKVIFTMPEAASVGLTEDDAREKYGDEATPGYCPLSSNAMSLFSGKSESFVKVLVHRKYGELLGVHMFGPDASEMIAEPAALMRMEVTANEIISDIIHVHSTWAEAFAEACADALDESIQFF